MSTENRRRTVVGQLAADAVKATPNAASKTLARKLHAEHPEVYPTLERARDAVRSVRGAHGDYHRRRTNTDDVPRRDAADAEACRASGYGLPDPEPSGFTPYTLPDDVSRWLSLADVHIPFHDKAALEAAFAWTLDRGGVDGILLNGDIADCYAISPWLRDPRKRTFKEEANSVGTFLDSLNATFRPKRIIYKAGNHEHRLERYLMARAPELFDLDPEAFSFERFLRFGERNVTWVPRGVPIYHHALTILHGDEYGNRFTSPVNPARGMYLKARECVLVAHEHRSSQHPERTLRGTLITCWSQGCLCNLHPEYRPLNNWNHGFTLLTGGSEWHIDNPRIEDGKIMP